MARAAEVGARNLVAELERQLKRGDDAETAIAVYKTASWLLEELDDVKALALEVAERDMRQRKLNRLETPLGSAGWPESEGPPQDKQSGEEFPGSGFFIA